MKIRKSIRQETTIYVLIWLIVLALPALLIQYYHSDSADNYPWHELWQFWRQMLLFLAAFLLHNFLLAPLIVYQRRHLLYFSLIAVLMASFVTVQCISRPDMGHIMSPDGRTHHQRPPMPNDDADSATWPCGGHFDEEPGQHAPQDRHHFPGPPDRRFDDRPPIFFGQHDVIATIMLVLMLGMNLGVKLFFRRREDEQHMAKLERTNLEQQLAFLRYQINPHFLMNTLNNIHALVDIDPEQAKETIVGLSKILRFVLYDGTKQLVPLDRETSHLANYIELMGMRVADQVDLIVDLPTQTNDAQVPPLLFITFVENAFKHGVSYQQHSFIDVHMAVTADQVQFVCRNSKVPPTSASNHSGGVGLKNARQRLDLIYGDSYHLDIEQDATAYTVTLHIPLTPPSKES